MNNTRNNLHENIIPKRTHKTLAISLSLLPFMQLGLNFYVSIQILIFLLVISLISAKDFSRNLTYGSILFLLMIIPILIDSVYDFNQSFFYTIRLYFCFITMISFIKNSNNFDYFNYDLSRILSIVSFGLLIFTLLQFFSFTNGSLMTIPREWYIMNSETLTNELNVMYGSRPSASFGEPSYLGFISLSIYVIVLKRFSPSIYKKITVFSLWCIILLSSTFSGLLSFVIISVIYLKKHLNYYTIQILIFAIVFSVLLIDIAPQFLPNTLIDRINDTSSGNIDDSTNSRIFKA